MEDATEWASQTKYLLDQINALAAGPRTRWRRFRLLEWVCEGCGDVLLEVMDTKPFRSYRVHTTRKARQVGRWTLPIALPDSPDHDGRRMLIHAHCRCQSHVLPSSLLWSDLEAGRRKRAVPAPTEASEPI